MGATARNLFLTCPEDCDEDFLLPGLTTDQDCFDWVPKDSQVSDLFLFPNTAALPTDWTDLTTWAGLISNSDTNNQAGKWVVGEGGLEVARVTLLELPKKKEKVTEKEYLLFLEIDNLNPPMYAFLRKFQCGWTDFVFFFLTLGGRLFGKEGGIKPSAVDVDFPLEEDRDGYETAVIAITFISDGSPDRTDVDPGVLEEEYPWITPGGDSWITPGGDEWVWTF